ncbi:MAG: bifunctional glutamate N-acetyltransferase/amino-acid acetyltransferase ArgJ [Treponema sp.]|jgi:glutamate N-acetyltransferase/amino-acid N-acetyltransferase|nr:bifunctional glutamate N-acetyltransferase/amino-acid acetyltransferase ArgJ [Treponema sp.]
MREIEGGVCAPKGFRAGGIRCGIKASSSKRDLALILADTPCTAAAVFTTNRVKAASVLVSREHLAQGICRAVIANSGNANACTGSEGLAAARRMAALAGRVFAFPAEQVAVASTGVIGVPLPIAAIEGGMDDLAASLTADASGHEAALEAIMTTDTRKKGGALETEIGGAAVRFGGMVKGSGMIHPNMATMLGFITTDAAISRELLDRALRRSVARSFNRLTVDGDTSTNDMVLVMASGAAGNPPIEKEGAGYEAFVEALETLCVKLTRAMARDGEGASRLLTVTVRGAVDEAAAEALAKSVASSSLVKTACFGADANWGRVLCALGYAGVSFDPEKVAVRFASAAGDILVCRKGAPVPFSEEKARKILLEEEIEIRIDLETSSGGLGGPGEAVVWGCDLTYDYVKINGDYRT